jgi:micrococcal nuclease
MARRTAWGQSPPPRRFRRRWSRGGVLFLAFLIFLAWMRWGGALLSHREAPPLELLPEGTYTLVRVVDGDTILVEPADGGATASGHARVRLIGIDAPESVKPDHPVEPWGKEAAEFTRDYLDDGPFQIRLDRRRKDRYDRFLAYVYVEEQLLNEALVRAGLSRAVHYPGDSPQIARRIREAEMEAQREQRGMWSEGNSY